MITSIYEYERLHNKTHERCIATASKRALESEIQNMFKSTIRLNDEWKKQQ